MRDIPKAGQIYRHFKGNTYQIVAIAKNSETEEKMVVYQPLYAEGDIWVRPLDMFMSKVDKEKYPEVEAEYRFTYVPEEELQVDSGIMEFLDADSYAERLKVFTSMQHRLTDDMINVMAVSMDTEVPEGPLDERIHNLKNYLLMQVKYECMR